MRLPRSLRLLDPGFTSAPDSLSHSQCRPRRCESVALFRSVEPFLRVTSAAAPGGRCGGSSSGAEGTEAVQRELLFLLSLQIGHVLVATSWECSSSIPPERWGGRRPLQPGTGWRLHAEQRFQLILIYKKHTQLKQYSWKSR